MVEPTAEISVPKRVNKKIPFILISTVVIIVLAFFFLAIFPYLVREPSRELASLNWSGYSAVSNLDNPQLGITGVNASWIVPSIKVSVDNSFSAEWIGIGGQFDRTLIQTGTGQDSIGGTFVYRSWYELFPGSLVNIDTLSVYAGDKITASISLVDANASTWRITLSDDTKKQSFSVDAFHVSSALSAEWIVERPTVAGRTETLADFGQVTFTECRATINGNVGTIASFPSNRITMDNDQNVPLVETSGLSGDGSSFTVRYLG